MKPFVKGHGYWGFLQQLVGATENGPLDCAQVTDQFSGRPSALRGPRFPLFGRDGVRGTQKFALRARQILDDGRK
jgi:hypothetical protein